MFDGDRKVFMQKKCHFMQKKYAAKTLLSAAYNYQVKSLFYRSSEAAVVDSDIDAIGARAAYGFARGGECCHLGATVVEIELNIFAASGQTTVIEGYAVCLLHSACESIVVGGAITNHRII